MDKHIVKFILGFIEERSHSYSHYQKEKFKAIKDEAEVQSAHWSHGSATLFTVHAWVSDGVTESMVFISDDHNHTKYSVYVFIQRIINLLKQKYPCVEQLDVFTQASRVSEGGSKCS